MLSQHTSPPSRVSYYSQLTQVTQIPPAELDALERVSRKYAFRANDYYLQLINWSDASDPLRRLVIPRADELDDGGSLDPSNEAGVTVAKGVQHKYPETVVLICTEVCGANCRYCFRKRLFMRGNGECGGDFSEALEYIAAHTEVTSVLLTGGDPLLMDTPRLLALLKALRDISHVKVIRIGTKIPAFNPWRILTDPELQSGLQTYSEPERRIYLMTHFDHPRELTGPATLAVDILLKRGLICANQCPLTRGINDDPNVLAELFCRLCWMGCPPYYVFQCRPTMGNRPYQVPIVRGWAIFRAALRHGSGLARRARFVMSHETGKIEILGVDERHIYLRYHRPKYNADAGAVLVCRRDDEACWLDELQMIGVSRGWPSYASRPCPRATRRKAITLACRDARLPARLQARG